ncbi:NfeD family protein [Salinibius halmophilus]|uniref:NfeD family protein n=1 Tax=Salinibius halmophilus TaxID=1853216 RepID=UPI000E6601D4|nr:NfeD family protein [Salinibius halmophilus]
MEIESYLYWLGAGLLLMIAEMLGAGGFLLGIGAGAFATGVITLIFPGIGLIGQLVVFAVSTCITAYLIWKYFVRHGSESQQPNLNRPAEQLVGRTATLTQAIDNGRGKIRINDANWFVTGPDLPEGSKVKVTGAEDASLLIVEPAD